MRIPRIYLPDADQGGTQLALPEGAFGHLVRVLRMNDGAELEIFNGRGQRFSAQLTNVGKRSAAVSCSKRCRRRRNHHCTRISVW